jgi:hypothetical protein
MELAEIADKGIRADALLNDEVFTEAMANLRNAIVQKWTECPIRDVEAQHELKLMVKLLADLEGNIRAFIQDGKMAAFELDSIRKSDEKIRKVRRYL